MKNLLTQFVRSRRVRVAGAVAAVALGAAVLQPQISLAPVAAATPSSSSTGPASVPTDSTRGVASYGPQLAQAMGAVVQVLVVSPQSGHGDGSPRGAPMSAAPGQLPPWLGDSQAAPRQPGQGSSSRGQGPNVMQSPNPPGPDRGQRGAPHRWADNAPQFNGAGSGVIYNAQRGLILTNHHVVAGATRVVVKLHDGREVEATVVGSDPATDIAVLRVSAQNLPQAVATSSSDEVQVGDLAFAIGYPMGLERTLTMGIVSGLNRSGIGEGIEDFIQTDASINRGNSGGPLVDSRGRLIGINTAIFSPTGGNIGIGFAVPSRIALSVAQQLESSGRVDRGRIGVSIGPVTPEAQAQGRLETPQGALIAAVEPGSPAARAGILSGDIVVQAGARPITNPRMLHAAVATTARGETLELAIIRAGRRVAVIVQVQEQRPREILAQARSGQQ